MRCYCRFSLNIYRKTKCERCPKCLSEANNEAVRHFILVSHNRPDKLWLLKIPILCLQLHTPLCRTLSRYDYKQKREKKSEELPLHIFDVWRKVFFNALSGFSLYTEVILSSGIQFSECSYKQTEAEQRCKNRV